MSDGEDTLIRMLRDDPLLGSMLLGAFGVESSAEKEAKKIANQRVQNAKDNLEFQKSADQRNQAAIDQLYSQLFGTPMPDKHANQAAPSAAPAASAPSVPGAALGAPGEVSPVPLPGYTPAYDPNTGATVYYPPASSPAATQPATQPAAAAPADLRRKAANPYLGKGEVPTGTVARVNEVNKPDPWTLPSAFAATEVEQGRTIEDLVRALEGIKDPDAVGYVGDITSEAIVSDAAKAAQKFAMDKLQANTDVKETAEEKLMRELARRKMEGQMKGDRDAMAQSLKSRGVYGSGAELASQLGAQSETANRRAFEELAAQANAQQRAMNALKNYSDAGFALGAQDLGQGRMHDIVNQTNQQLKQQGEQFKAKQQIEMNRDKVSRDTAGYNAKSRGTAMKDEHTRDISNVLSSLTGLRVGANTTGANLVSKGHSDLDPKFASQQAEILANDETGKGLVLGSLGL